MGVFDSSKLQNTMSTTNLEKDYYCSNITALTLWFTEWHGVKVVTVYPPGSQSFLSEIWNHAMYQSNHHQDSKPKSFIMWHDRVISFLK